MKERLGLSDEQTRQIRGILREARKKSIKFWAELRVARNLMDFLWAPTTESQDANISIITMVENGSGRLGPLSEEPDAILNSWLGANQR